MRDIRGDLQERANLLEQQINAAKDHFVKLVEQLKREHESRLRDLKAELDTVNRVMEIEQQRLRSATSVPKSQPPQPLADFLVRKLSELGPMSGEDLCRLAVQEGYFVDGDSAQEGVQATLMHVVKAGQIQQLPNARFSFIVSDMTRLRRAI
jgi:hypothetical protein